MNKVTEMSVSTPEQFLKAIRISQNILSENTIINVINHGECFARTTKLVSELQLGITSLYKSTSGSFATAQLSGYSLRLISDPFGRFSKVLVNSRYFSNTKELNDLICICAEIAELLNLKVRESNNTLEKINLFDKWVSDNFEYKNTNQVEDHTAIELLKNRSGVCQAIAAIAVLVLSYMGEKVLYISGEGKGKNGWGLHAWNAVKINGQWTHVDFTFSMNSLRLPCTKSEIEEMMFKLVHRWDINEFCEHSMENKWKNIYWQFGEKTDIYINDSKCCINGINVQFEEPLIIHYKQNKYIDIAGIIQLLGGGIEMIPPSDIVNICVCNKRYVIKNALKNYNNGYFDSRILSCIWENEWIDGTTLRITI